jgi:hypothetical protein
MHPSAPRPRRAPVSRALAALAAAVALSSAGCLDFDKQTIVVGFVPDKDEVHVLFVYEGLHVAGKEKSDLKKAQEGLTELLTTQKAFYVGHPMLRMPLQPDEKTPSAKDKKIFDLFGKHLSLGKAEAFLGADDRLGAAQVLTIKDARQFVDRVNELISEGVAEDLERALKDPKTPKEDLESLRLIRKAAKERFAWVRLEPGRLRVTVPGTPAFFARARSDVIRGASGFAELSQLLTGPVPPGGRPADHEERVRHKVAEVNRFIEAAGQTPWGLEQGPDRLTFSLGLGGGRPIHILSPYYPNRPGARADELLGFARTLSVDLKKDPTADQIITRFVRAHRPHKE